MACSSPRPHAPQGGAGLGGLVAGSAHAQALSCSLRLAVQSHPPSNHASLLRPSSPRRCAPLVRPQPRHRRANQRGESEERLERGEVRASQPSVAATELCRRRARASTADVGTRGFGAESEQGAGGETGTGRRSACLPFDCVGASRSNPTLSQRAAAGAELRAEFRAMRAQQSTLASGAALSAVSAASLIPSPIIQEAATRGSPGEGRVPALGRTPMSPRSPTHTELVREYRRLAACDAAVRCDRWDRR